MDWNFKRTFPYRAPQSPLARPLPSGQMGRFRPSRNLSGEDDNVLWRQKCALFFLYASLRAIFTTLAPITRATIAIGDFSKISVFIAADSRVVQDRLVTLLGELAGIKIVGQARTAPAAGISP